MLQLTRASSPVQSPAAELMMSEKAGRVAGDTHDDKSNIMWRERKGWLEPYCTVQSVQDITHRLRRGDFQCTAQTTDSSVGDSLTRLRVAT